MSVPGPPRAYYRNHQFHNQDRHHRHGPYGGVVLTMLPVEVAGKRPRTRFGGAQAGEEPRHVMTIFIEFREARPQELLFRVNHRNIDHK